MFQYVILSPHSQFMDCVSNPSPLIASSIIELLGMVLPQLGHTIWFSIFLSSFCALVFRATIITVSRHTGYQHDSEEVVSIEHTGLSVFVLHRPKKPVGSCLTGYNVVNV